MPVEPLNFSTPGVGQPTSPQPEAPFPSQPPPSVVPPPTPPSPPPVIPPAVSVPFEPPQQGVELMKQVVSPPESAEATVVRETAGEISHAGIPAIQPSLKSLKNYKILYIIGGAIVLLALLGTGFYFFVWPKLQKQPEVTAQPPIELPPPPPQAPETPTQPPTLPELPTVPEAPVQTTTPESTSTVPAESPLPQPPPAQESTPTPSIEESKVTIVFNKNKDVWGWALNDKIYLRWNPKNFFYFTVAERIGGSLTWNTIAKAIPLPEYERTIPLAAKRIDLRVQGVDQAGKVLESYFLITFNL